MLGGGYILVYRSLLDWEWYDDANTLRVFLHLLLTVNYESNQWHGITIERGQRVASYAVLASELRLSEKSVRTAINHLKQTGEVAHTGHSKYGLFTVINYDKYQQRAEQEADSRQEAGTPAAPNGQQRNKANKANKAKEIKEIIYGEESPASSKRPYGEFGKVNLTDEQYQTLVQRMGKDGAEDYIARLDGWLAEGHTKKNHYATILNWWRKDGGQSKVSASKKQPVKSENIFLEMLREE